MKEVPINQSSLCRALIAATCSLAANLATTGSADPPSAAPPIPSPSPIRLPLPPRVQPLRVATVTLSDQSTVLTKAATGKFQMVAARPGETVTAVVPMPVSAVPLIASIQALDGGGFVPLPSASVVNNLGQLPVTIQLPTAVSVPVVNGKVTFNFQVGAYPGLYRVLVLGLGRPATLQFWVQNVQRPATNPWALNASHWQTQ